MTTPDSNPQPTDCKLCGQPRENHSGSYLKCVIDGIPRDTCYTPTTTPISGGAAHTPKDKPDFETLAIEIVGEGCKPGDHNHDCACGHCEEGMDAIWVKYVTPLLAKLFEYENVTMPVVMLNNKEAAAERESLRTEVDRLERRYTWLCNPDNCHESGGEDSFCRDCADSNNCPYHNPIIQAFREKADALKKEKKELVSIEEAAKRLVAYYNEFNTIDGRDIDILAAALIARAEHKTETPEQTYERFDPAADAQAEGR